MAQLYQLLSENKNQAETLNPLNEQNLEEEADFEQEVLSEIEMNEESKIESDILSEI